MVSPIQKQLAVEAVLGMGLTQSRARICRLVELNRSSAYYREAINVQKLAQEGLVEEVSRKHPCWGYRKITAVLRQTHSQCINAKRVARLRRRSGLLAARRATKRRRLSRDSAVRRSATRPDEVWSYDFIQDATASGGQVRILSIIDEYTRECLYLRGLRSFPARCVIDALEEVMMCLGRKPEHIRSDNGPEFIAKSVQCWMETARITACYIQPGSPWENGHVESFHASLRTELLDRELFFNMAEVNHCLDNWREEYNYVRPHGSLNNLPPTLATSAQVHAGN